MDITTLLVTVGGSAAAVAAVGFLLRQSFQTLLDARLAAYEKKLEETAALHARQADGMISLLETTYRIRNAVRDLAETSPEWRAAPADPRLANLETCYNTLQEQLYKHRAVMPETLFQLFHELKGPTQGILSFLAQERRRRSRGEQPMPHALTHISETLDRISEIYEVLVPQVHGQLGVK